MKIQQEFQAHNPKLVYVDHKYLDGGKIGISFIALRGSNVLGGVRIYKTVNGQIDWYSKPATVDSWADIKQRQR